MSRIENCDLVVGSGPVVITAGVYKTADEKTRYKFGMKVSPPSKVEMGEELWDSYSLIGQGRVRSVKAAGLFNEKTEFGTQEDAEAFVAMFSTVAGMTEALEKARREGGAVKVDSSESLAIKKLAGILRDKVAAGEIATAKVAVPKADNPPMMEKGGINFNAWAKILREEKHPWYEVALKLVKQTKGFE